MSQSIKKILYLDYLFIIMMGANENQTLDQPEDEIKKEKIVKTDIKSEKEKDTSKNKEDKIITKN